MSEHQAHLEVEPVTLRPRLGAAVTWSVLGALLVAAGAFFVLDSSGHPIAWATLALFLAVALYFLAQLVSARVSVVELDREHLRARTYGRRTEVAWDDVHVATVRRVAGDPVLVLDVRDPNGRQDVIGVLLPVGCDLDALHDFLAARLGRGPAVETT